MSEGFRLAEGGRIDRNRRVGFSFNGRRLHGYEGDTLASALLANGIRLVGRSFKFHRPRGVMSAGEEECNALLEVDSGDGRVPSVRATLARLTEGLDARSQNCFPASRLTLAVPSTGHAVSGPPVSTTRCSSGQAGLYLRGQSAAPRDLGGPRPVKGKRDIGT